MAAETFFQPGSIFQRARDLLRQAELPGDALLGIYFAVFARQYLWWGIPDNGIAWIISSVFGVVLASLYILTRNSREQTEADQRVGFPFWLLVVLPLAFVYSVRVAFPDGSFDVWNYRIFHAERAMRGVLFLPNEFFPTPAPYNPAPDMVTGIFRHVLGYRLGTIANLLAMIWVARVVDKLLRPFLQHAWVRASGVLLIVFAEHLLFEINNYLVDLLALPLLLEATYLAFFSPARGPASKDGAVGWSGGNAQVRLERRDLVCIALLLGMSVAFKLTNASIALPIVLLCAYHAVARCRDDGVTFGAHAKRLAMTSLLCAVAFLAPLLPFSFYLYRDTGSPVFPVFNGIFKSLNWPAHSVWDPRWGPFGLWENLLWPILISFKPERLSELAVYSGRISLGVVVAMIGLFLFRRKRRLRELALLLIATSLLWSASTGYIRYALYVEVLAPIVVLIVAVQLVRQTSMRGTGFAVACLLWAGLIFQTFLAGYYVSQQEWSQRPNVLTTPGGFRSEARYLLRDQSLRSFLDPETRQRVDDVEVWIGSSIKTSAITIMLRPDAPTIGVNQGEYFVTPESRERFRQTLDRAAGKRMFSLVFNEKVEEAIATLRQRGLVATEVVQLEIPYYSHSGRLKTSLIEVTRTKEEPAVATVNPPNEVPGGLADSAYRAKIATKDQPGELTAGDRKTLVLTVRNVGNGVWPSRVPQGFKGVVRVGNRWLNGDGTLVVNELDSRAVLPHDLGPGDEAQFTLNVTVPSVPGNYVLEIDMVHEGLTWFHQRGSQTLRWTVRVVK